MERTAEIVLAVSQAVEPRGRDEPDTDFFRLSRLLGAHLVGNKGHSRNGLMRRFENVTALDIGQALSVVRRFPNADAYISFSERVGIPLGMLIAKKKRRPAHLIIAHRLDTRAKRLLRIAPRFLNGVDDIITLCSSQLQYAERLAPGRSVFIKGGIIDHEFYRPSDRPEEDFVLSVGSESRDYKTLVEAVSRTPYNLKIVSSSPWSRKRGRSTFASNGRVECLPRLSFIELRELYEKARVVAIPLLDVKYAAGLNAVLEGFCMKKAIVVSAGSGIADYVKHMCDSYVIASGDASAMSAALERVYSDESLRTELKQGTQETVRTYANIDQYMRDLKDRVECLIGAKR